MLTEFQKRLKSAIQECYCMKPISNNEDVKLWIEQNEKAQIILNELVSANNDIEGGLAYTPAIDYYFNKAVEQINEQNNPD